MFWRGSQLFEDINDEDGVFDGHVRIPRSALHELRLCHHASGFDVSVRAVPSTLSDSHEVTGYTEWIGKLRGLEVSVGWDWLVVGGVVSVLNPAEIRTNILIIPDTDVSPSPMLTRIYLLEYIESVPWQKAIQDLIDQSKG